MRPIKITQIRFFILTILTYAFIFWAGSAHAVGSGKDAVAFVDDFAKRSLNSLTDENASIDELRKIFGALYDEAFDHKVIARFTLGRYNRTASEDEKQEFSRLFRLFLVDAYAARFRLYRGELDVVDAVPDGDNLFLVKSLFEQDELGAPIEVVWRVGFDGAKYQIYDMNIAGVSLAVTQRSEIASLIKNEGGVEGMLQILRDKTKR